MLNIQSLEKDRDLKERIPAPFTGPELQSKFLTQNMASSAHFPCGEPCLPSIHPFSD